MRKIVFFSNRSRYKTKISLIREQKFNKNLKIEKKLKKALFYGQTKKEMKVNLISQQI